MRQSKLCLVMLLGLAVIYINPHAPAWAEEPDSSSEVGIGDSEDNRVTHPAESKRSVGRKTDGVGRHIYVHNKNGATRDWLIIRLKEVADGVGQYGAVQLKVTEVKRKGELQYEPVEHDMSPNNEEGHGVAKTGAVSQTTSQEGEIRIHFPNGWTHRTVIRLEVELTERSSWQAEFEEGDNIQDMNLYSARGATIIEEIDEPAETGANAEPKSGAFYNHNIDPTPVASDGGAGTFDAPDLAVGEAGNAPLTTGILEFVPLADASFQLGATPPSVRVLDAEGLEILDPNRVEIGTIDIVHGRFQAEIAHRDPNEPAGIAIVVANLEINVPAIVPDQQIGYTVTGTATHGYSVSPAPLVIRGEPSYSVSLATAWATVDDPVAGPAYLPIGDHPTVVRADDESNVEGYVRGVAIAESEAGAIGDGAVEFRPLDDYQFVSDPETNVYILDAETGGDAWNAFDSASLTTTDDGGVRLSLQGRQAMATRLKIVLANARVDLGTGPFSFGRNARLGIGGTALPNVVDRNVMLAVGAPRGEADPESGPWGTAHDFIGWTPAGGFE